MDFCKFLFLNRQWRAHVKSNQSVGGVNKLSGVRSNTSTCPISSYAKGMETRSPWWPWGATPNLLCPLLENMGKLIYKGRLIKCFFPHRFVFVLSWLFVYLSHEWWNRVKCWGCIWPRASFVKLLGSNEDANGNFGFLNCYESRTGLLMSESQRFYHYLFRKQQRLRVA